MDEKREKLQKEYENLCDELESAALPLRDFLYKHYHPHAYAVVTQAGVEITEGNLATPFALRD